MFPTIIHPMIVEASRLIKLLCGKGGVKRITNNCINDTLGQVLNNRKNDSMEVNEREEYYRGTLVTKPKEIRVWGTTVWRAPLSVKPAR